MELDEIPVVDLAMDNKGALVATIDFALRKYGFFYVTNHGIPSSLIEQQFQVAHHLFDLPLETKQAMKFDPVLDVGYVGSGVQSLDQSIMPAQSRPDTKEQFMMTNNVLITDNNTPSEKQIVDPDDIFKGSFNYSIPGVPQHKEVTRAYASAAYELNLQLNKLLFDALQLDSCDRECLGCDPFMVLKQMKYAGEPSDPAKGILGAGAHADWGSFTILATDKTPGLQVQMPETGNWLEIPPRQNCLIINSGDQIAQLTNNVYRSAVHRVVTRSRKPRYSTAVFTYFNMNAPVKPLRQFVSKENPAQYPTRTSKEYFHFKLNQSVGGPAVQ